MKCIQVREELIEAGAAPQMATAEVRLHLAGCSACSEEWKAMQQTMALLDEWQAPEPSPYFATRLRARVREEAQQPVGFAARLRNVFGTAFLAGRTAALASAMAVLLLGGIVMFRSAQDSGEQHPLHASEAMVSADRGTPVADLETLDKNFDIYSSFDLLDDVGGNTGVSN
jgi:anti-sigma factor RsiW